MVRLRHFQILTFSSHFWKSHLTCSDIGKFCLFKCLLWREIFSNGKKCRNMYFERIVPEKYFLQIIWRIQFCNYFEIGQLPIWKFPISQHQTWNNWRNSKRWGKNVIEKTELGSLRAYWQTKAFPRWELSAFSGPQTHQLCPVKILVRMRHFHKLTFSSHFWKSHLTCSDIGRFCLLKSLFWPKIF